jgi:hypothetical protein
MKLLCVGCDAVMAFAERELPGDGTMAAVFTCPTCGSETALLTNPMETRLVSGLGIEIGGRTVPAQPMELVRSSLATGGAPVSAPPSPGTIPWSEAARQRLDVVPAFVRGMVKRIYGEYAVERGITEITPAVMDQARRDLGLEGM